MSADSLFPLLGEQPLFPEPPPRPSFEQRIQRAHELSGRYPVAAELLGFYSRLAFLQQHIFDSLGENAAKTDMQASWPLKLDLLLPRFPNFARSLTDIAPAPMRDRASALASSSTAAQQGLLTGFWDGNFAEVTLVESPADRFIALAFLQPYAEWLAQSGSRVTSVSGHATCPVCASEPICSVLRDQDHGARRSLICSLCMNEWSFLRAVCPACGEDRFESLPVFTPQEIPHVRIDACETCRHYVKTIDMTKDGLAVPIVDELAAVSLDLWAAEKGYQKLVPNLAGL